MRHPSLRVSARLVALACLGLLSFGCGDGTLATPPAACVSSADCETGTRCVDGRCLATRTDAGTADAGGRDAGAVDAGPPPSDRDMDGLPDDAEPARGTDPDDADSDDDGLSDGDEVARGTDPTVWRGWRP
jgi:hypothetical protein